MFRYSGPDSDAWICTAAAGSVIINDMVYCQQAVTGLEFCGNSLAERRTNAAETTRQLLISRNDMARFPGIRIKVTIQTAAAGRRLTRHGPGNAWETANSW
jgi:hypothetical protein